MTRVLRLIAVVIAVAGAWDPVITIERRAREPLTITIVDTPTLDLPDGSETRRQRAYRSAEAIASALRRDFAVAVREQPVNSTADPCPGEGACVVISDGARPRTLDARSGPFGAVRVGGPLSPNVAIRAVRAPRRVDLSALGAIEVELEARGIGGVETTVTVFDGDVAVGSAAHTWNDTREEARAAVRVEWVPLGPGPRDLRIVASASPGEAVLEDNEVRSFAVGGGEPATILVYDPQPGWGSTFVRRGLEPDPRFNVMLRARLGPSHTAASAPLRLSAESLEDEHVAVVVVSSPHALTKPEIDALERWTRLRGGSVVMLFESAPSGELARVLQVYGKSRLEPAPIPVGLLKASELIVFSTNDPRARTLAEAGRDAVIVSRPVGRGQIVAAGAVDAWRYRSDGSFETFWRSLVADLAAATGDRLAVSTNAQAIAAGDTLEIEAEWRSVRATPGSVSVAAMLRCPGTDDTGVRLLPSGSLARFRGVVDPVTPGACEVVVTLAGLGEARVPVRVLRTAPGPMTATDALSPAVTAYGGMVVDAGDETGLINAFRASTSAQLASVPLRPMRTGWWLVPFAACLGLEWWVRRRRGLL
jgi:hypothetical protein